MLLSQLLQIVHNISRALDVDSRLARLEERSRNMQINDESLCDSCYARLGTKLFAMYPDDTIVCYKVSAPLTVSLVTKAINACPLLFQRAYNSVLWHIRIHNRV